MLADVRHIHAVHTRLERLGFISGTISTHSNLNHSSFITFWTTVLRFLANCPLLLAHCDLLFVQQWRRPRNNRVIIILLRLTRATPNPLLELMSSCYWKNMREIWCNATSNCCVWPRVFEHSPHSLDSLASQRNSCIKCWFNFAYQPYHKEE